MRRRALPPWSVVALLFGCRDADIERIDASGATGDARLEAATEPADAGELDASDAAPFDGGADVGPGRDARVDDTGATADSGTDAGDAGPPDDVLFADDFDDATFDDDWMLRNGTAMQRDGALVSGASCMSSVACDEGPMLLATTELLELGDGRLTLDYDVFTGISARYTNRVLVDLHAEVGGARIEANPDGSTRLLDAVLRTFWHIGGSEPFELFTVCARCFRDDAAANEFMVGGDDDAWYHVSARFCGSDGMGIRLTSSTSGVTLIDDDGRTRDASLPPDVSRAYLLVWIEGAGKRIDNLVLRRGCD